MEPSYHSMSHLFAQLGLPNNEQDIATFIARNKGIDTSITIEKASFWTSSQAAFLAEAIAEDADWAEVVDMLDAQLR